MIKLLGKLDTEKINPNTTDIDTLSALEIVRKINTEDQQAIAAHFQIRSIPTLMIFREQIIIFAEAGMLPGNDGFDNGKNLVQGVHGVSANRMVAMFCCFGLIFSIFGEFFYIWRL